MKNVTLLFALLTVTDAANALTATLLAHNYQRSDYLVTLIWNGADGNPASTAVWDWDSATGTLSMNGTYRATWHVASEPLGRSIYGDEVVNMTINTMTLTTTAASYNCVEGTFLASVGANGCLNTDLGVTSGFPIPVFGVNDSSAAYNVGGNANCINRTIGGDDISTGPPRGLFSAPAIGGCDAVEGDFELFRVVQDSGGTLILSNADDISLVGANYMTFSVIPIPSAIWLFGSALGLIGMMRRKISS